MLFCGKTWIHYQYLSVQWLRNTKLLAWLNRTVWRVQVLASQNECCRLWRSSQHRQLVICTQVRIAKIRQRGFLLENRKIKGFHGFHFKCLEVKVKKPILLDNMQVPGPSEMPLLLSTWEAQPGDVGLNRVGRKAVRHHRSNELITRLHFQTRKLCIWLGTQIAEVGYTLTIIDMFTHSKHITRSKNILLIHISRCQQPRCFFWIYFQHVIFCPRM